MAVVVFGSINLDLVTRSPHLPRPGETVLGSAFAMVPGGKGANQAVAAARLGAVTHLVGRLGADLFGDRLQGDLEAAGVQTAGILRDDRAQSGVAAIALDEAGENHIIVVPGANGRLDQSDCDRLRPLLAGAKVLLLQLEIPLEAAIAAARMAHALGVTVILDPAPAPAELPADLYPCLDFLTPNQTEAAQLVGFGLETPEAVVAAAQALRSRGVGTVILKLGGQGAYCLSAQGGVWLPAFPVQAVDTVAAGDAFNGALAAALDGGLSLSEALRWAMAAGAIAVTQSGAQSAMPTQATLKDFLRQQAS